MKLFLRQLLQTFGNFFWSHLVKLFLGNVYKHLAIFSGHTGHNALLVVTDFQQGSVQRKADTEAEGTCPQQLFVGPFSKSPFVCWMIKHRPKNILFTEHILESWRNCKFFLETKFWPQRTREKCKLDYLLSKLNIIFRNRKISKRWILKVTREISQLLRPWSSSYSVKKIPWVIESLIYSKQRLSG